MCFLFTRGFEFNNIYALYDTCHSKDLAVVVGTKPDGGSILPDGLTVLCDVNTHSYTVHFSSILQRVFLQNKTTAIKIL